ncbi:MAG TPA: hypothetical protein VLB76_00225 [Thermoanaerobaculia bacterium]|jgi:hypothetical protein|nr:hypothetical protein [Thermoanaerobaculia bacterium]
MKTFVRGGLLLLALAGSIAVSIPERVAALTCPAGSLQGHIRIYYSDASYTTVVCRTNDCGGDDFCNDPTPYYTETTVCCRPR